MTIAERIRELRGAEWRGTVSFEFDGPSTRTCHSYISVDQEGRVDCPYTFVIDNFKNGSQATRVGAAVEDDDAADFDLLPLGGLDVDFGHCRC